MLVILAPILRICVCFCVRSLGVFAHTAVAVRDQYTHLRVKINDSEVLQESTPETTDCHQRALMLKDFFILHIHISQRILMYCTTLLVDPFII